MLKIPLDHEYSDPIGAATKLSKEIARRKKIRKYVEWSILLLAVYGIGALVFDAYHVIHKLVR